MVPIYIISLLLILAFMTLLWVVSVKVKNASIIDPFWGLGFVLVNSYYFFSREIHYPVQILLFVLVTLWGLRLSIYLAWRNRGKGEDPRYQEFRKKYGEKRYWWVSFFQVYLLQGILMWIISTPLLGVNLYASATALHWLDYLALLLWVVGFLFEAGADYQLSKFRKDSTKKGTVLNTGFWRYSRHPNYFGESAMWWAYALLCISSGSYWLVTGSILMTLLIIKVSGVVLLEKSLKEAKPQYKEYIRKTSSFIPWFPRK